MISCFITPAGDASKLINFKLGLSKTNAPPCELIKNLVRFKMNYKTLRDRLLAV